MNTPQEKTSNNVSEDTEFLQAKATLLNYMFGYADSLILKSAVELRIADIIHSHGRPISLSQIASHIDSPTKSPNIPWLERIMRFLVHKQIFTLDSSSGEDLYGPTPASRWVLHDYELSLAPVLLTFTHPAILDPWQEISRSIKECGTYPFRLAHNGLNSFEKASGDPVYNEVFNSGMSAITKANLNAIVVGYKEGFSGIEDGSVLVDVGGNLGKAVAEIVKVYPHIKGVNFDLPHVVATAPEFPGVTHVGGDMFQDIPKADVVFIKSVLHDWGDEDCLKILKNCRDAILEKNGKLIIVEVVIDPKENGLFQDIKLYSDLLMMAGSIGGKERTKDEWIGLLKGAGFDQYNFITIPSFLSIIEAYPH